MPHSSEKPTTPTEPSAESPRAANPPVITKGTALASTTATPPDIAPPLAEIPPLTLADTALLPALISMSRRIKVQTLQVFDAIGGVQALAKWAQENPKEYYTQVLPKVMPKEVEQHASGTLEDYIEELDKRSADAKIIDSSPNIPNSQPDSVS
jgi:hypothetical protein